MFEVILLVIGLFIVLVLFFFYGNSIESRIISEKQRIINLQNDKLKIAEKKYMKGKIKQDVFEELKNDIQYSVLLLELDVFRLKKMHHLEIEGKALQLIAKLKKPTPHIKIVLKHKLIESEILIHELKIIETKMMKNEISAELFKKMIKQKENELLDKEAEMVDLIKTNSE